MFDPRWQAWCWLGMPGGRWPSWSTTWRTHAALLFRFLSFVWDRWSSSCHLCWQHLTHAAKSLVIVVSVSEVLVLVSAQPAHFSSMFCCLGSFTWWRPPPQLLSQCRLRSRRNTARTLPMATQWPRSSFLQASQGIILQGSSALEQLVQIMGILWGWTLGTLFTLSLPLTKETVIMII